jgi:UDP-glucose 4-epimerase
MKNIVVTGATSFIGVSLTNRLIRDGYRVFAVVRPGSANLYRLSGSNSLRVIELDMDNIAALPDMVSENIEMFFHLAWEGTRAPYRDNPELQQRNYHNSMRAIEAAVELKSRVFVGAGSQAEYGKFNGKVDETYRTQPVTEYGKAKLNTYRHGVERANCVHMDFVWSRIFSVYGEYDYPSTLIMTCIGKMLKNEVVPLTRCVQKWDYLYVDDAADALVRLGQKGKNGEVYNIASGVSKPLKDFVLEIKAIVGSQSELGFGLVPYGKEGPVSFEPNINKIRVDLGWYPQTDFEIGVRRIIRYLKGES